MTFQYTYSIRIGALLCANVSMHIHSEKTAEEVNVKLFFTARISTVKPLNHWDKLKALGNCTYQKVESRNIS